MEKRNGSLLWTKWLSALHLAFAAIMLGNAVAFLILSLTAAATEDEVVLKGCYTAMHALAGTSVRASTIGTVVTGLLLSARTKWGFFRYYWIIAKEVLTTVSIALGPIGMYDWSQKAVVLTRAEGLGALQDPAYAVNAGQLWTGIVLQILSLAAMYAISVFKPWGPRPSNNRSNPVS